MLTCHVTGKKEFSLAYINGWGNVCDIMQGKINKGDQVCNGMNKASGLILTFPSVMNNNK